MDRKQEIRDQIAALQKELIDIQNRELQEWDEKKQKDYAACKDHHYISSGGKWSPQGQMTCEWCGHTIGR